MDALFASLDGVQAPIDASAAFDRLLERERVEFLETLVGADSSTGVPAVAASQVEAYPPALRAVRAVLYDTLALGYMRGYERPRVEPGASARGSPGEGDVSDPLPVAEFDEELHRAAYAVLRLATCVMGEFIA